MSALPGLLEPARAAAGRFPRPHALGAFALVLGLAAANGGYFPTSWGWATVALLWATATSLLVRAPERPGRLEVAFLCGVAGLAATVALSALWSPSATDALTELQRDLLYVAGALALVVSGRRARADALLAGALAAIVVVALYALATRLFPERLGTFDPVAGYRLAEPIGYWNGLGVLCAVGVLLALGFAARASSPAARAAAAAAPAVLLPTLYFTFGRGPWIALGLGLIVLIAADGRRLHLAATAAAALPWAAVGVLVAARSHALTRLDASLPEASAQGHRLALLVVVLAGCAGLATVSLARLERRYSPGRRARAVAAGLLGLVLVVAVVTAVAREGGPARLASSAYRSFTGPPPSVRGDLGARLFSLSGNGRADLWRVALEQAAAHPLAGAGAGSYEAAWLARRELDLKVRDAHSLYLETLAELGPPGLLLLLGGLGAPVAAAVLARRNPRVPAALAAYVAFLAHAGADWDWELAAVTLVGLLCGGVLLLAARPSGPPLAMKPRLAVLAASIALLPVAGAGLLGASALAASAGAAAKGDWAGAEHQARRAGSFAPWSSEPPRLLGEARLAVGDLAGARASFERALARDERDWSLWLDLARASEGTARRLALARAQALNPRSPEIARFRSEVEGLESPAEAVPQEVSP